MPHLAACPTKPEHEKTEAELRAELVEIAGFCHQRNLLAASDGNLSVRLDARRILITPSGVMKFLLHPEDLLVIDFEGRTLSGAGRPSSDYRLHTVAYTRRPAARAVIHAHPPTATAFTLSGIAVAQCILPEVVIALGEIVVAPYATPSSEGLGRSIVDALDRTDAILLERHGSLTVGRSLLDAYGMQERIEHAAQMTWTARTLGNVRPLPPDEVERLLAIRERLGLGKRPEPCNRCGACVGGFLPAPVAR